MTTIVKNHPIYVKATQDSYIDTADQAKLIRSALASHFPTVKFAVRLSRYAGGSSIRVYYDGRIGYKPLDSCFCPDGPTLGHDGGYQNRCGKCGHMRPCEPIYRPGVPTKDQVNDVVAPYAGGDFDGMNDLAFDVSTWLLPDGTAVFGRSNGGGASIPGYNHARPVPGAVLAKFSARYVFVNDTL